MNAYKTALHNLLSEMNARCTAAAETADIANDQNKAAGYTNISLATNAHIATTQYFQMSKDRDLIRHYLQAAQDTDATLTAND